ncbi:MAG: FtsX-like permease family protein [Candidatus Moranbacteria bacterium]|nr:FtsX-like permease family protein [Candidatus Moranbacteria bacterium]
MKIFIRSFKIAISNLKGNLFRTLLSLIGIVIGVGATILIMSFGQGMKNFVIDQVQSFGTNIIQIEPKVPKVGHVSAQNVSSFTTVTSLKLEDAEKIAQILDIEDWYAAVIDQRVINNKDKNESIMIMGVTSKMDKVDNQFKIKKGRMFFNQEDKSQKQYALLGSKVKEKLFPNQEAVGKDVKIDKKRFKVIAVLEERGSTGFFDFDELVFTPLQTQQNKVMGVDHIQSVIFKVKDSEKMDYYIGEMEYILRQRHDIDDPQEDDFAVTSISEAIEMIDKVFVWINFLLLALTSISLVVAGVGITNVMYVSVAQRTFEIGLRKAIGAKKSDILAQFLMEALLLTFIGGILGVILGYLLGFAGELVIKKFGFELDFTVTPGMIFIGFGFSAAIGLIFGLKPALKAADLSPMQAIKK